MKLGLSPTGKTLLFLALVPLALLILGTIASYLSRESISNAGERTAQTQTYFEMLKNMPLYWMGYLFGLLGGLFRGGIMTLRKEFEPGVSVVLGQFIVGGILGIMSAVVLQSSLFEIFLFGFPKDQNGISINLEDTTVSASAIVLIAFLLGMFASEVSDNAKRRLFKQNEDGA